MKNEEYILPQDFFNFSYNDDEKFFNEVYERLGGNFEKVSDEPRWVDTFSNHFLLILNKYSFYRETTTVYCYCIELALTHSLNNETKIVKTKTVAWFFYEKGDGRKAYYKARAHFNILSKEIYKKALDNKFNLGFHLGYKPNKPFSQWENRMDSSQLAEYELFQEKIKELINKLQDSLIKVRSANEENFFVFWEDFENYYRILNNWDFENKLTSNDSDLLSELRETLDSFIESKEREIQHKIDKILEEIQNLHGEEAKDRYNQWCEYDKARDKINSYKRKFLHEYLEEDRIKREKISEELEQMTLRQKEKEELSRKILANQEDYTDEQIKKAKEFLSVFFGEEN